MVKICGITRLQDALTAVGEGASAVGFVFWPGSPRFIDPFRARRIAAELPPLVATVGVFVNQPATYIDGVASVVPLSAIQLHGDEPPEFAASLSRPVMKAVHGDPGDATRWPERVLLMVDSRDSVRRGGTGQTADWGMAAAMARRRRMVLAGGLTPENIGEALARVRPFGVDVSSGVESSPGVKDARRMAALFAAIGQRQAITS
jgi:phosphoribosylanthranilate isomerase